MPATGTGILGPGALRWAGGWGDSSLIPTKGLLDRGLSLPRGAGGQLSDVTDDGSRAGNSIWGGEAGAAVGQVGAS